MRQPKLPFAPLPAIEIAMQRELEAAALEANQRYLVEVIEEHSFCPFSRGGRAQGQTARSVFYLTQSDISPLTELMIQSASQPDLVVIQAIFPLIETSPEAWIEFCQEVTELGNRRLGGSDVFAVASLHPELPYHTTNPYTLIPLFRRSPDPTIQWVRIDALDALYEGRTGDTTFVDPSDIMSFMQKRHQPPLFERIAKTNQQMANRLGIDRVEESLAEISTSARKRYANILLGGGQPNAPAPPLRQTCPCPVQSTAEQPPALNARKEDKAWALVALRELTQREPRHVRVDDIDLVVVRVGSLAHVLYGRCPHRMALLSESIVENDRLICRHHGWDFSFDTGLSRGVPGESIHHFEAWIDDGQVWIRDDEVEKWRLSNSQTFDFSQLEAPPRGG